MASAPVEWTVTIVAVLALIGLDLFRHRKPKEVSVKESLWGTIGWTVIGLLFGLVVIALDGTSTGMEYFAGYTLERALSFDNVFVFVLILGYFAVPPKLQHRALLFGVIVALLMRAVFIVIGAGMLNNFHWTLLVFGGFLLYTAYKLATSDDEEVEPERNFGLRLLRKVMPVTDGYRGHTLLTKENGVRAATPLFAVLLVIGTTDLLFAVDSIPAIFGVTNDAYVVFTANAFSLLGMRSMTFLLANLMDRFAYLKHVLTIVLAFVGIKMILEYFHIPHDGIPVWVSLAAIVTTITGGILFSVVKTRNQTPQQASLVQE